MFHNIPDAVKDRMDYLEKIDIKDRDDGTSKCERLRQVPQDTGKFLAFMLALSPDGAALEIGASGGYSALWLALACREEGRKLVTFEVLDEKVKIARETFVKAGVLDVVELIQGDARELIGHYDQIAFCFLDCEKEYYRECYEAIIPRMIKGGILVADNAISHAAALASFLDRAYDDERVDVILVPFKTGELVCRKR